MWLGDVEGDVITKDVITKCGRRGNRTLNLTVTRVKIGRFKQLRYYCRWLKTDWGDFYARWYVGISRSAIERYEEIL